MKLTNILSITLLSAYSMTAFLGIGVFYCNCTHSKRIVMMSAQPSCQCNSSTESCCSHNDKYPVEEDNCEGDCCALVYQDMDIDQLAVVQRCDIQAKVLSLFFTPFLLVDGFTTGIRECVAILKNHSPPGLLKIPPIYMFAQLRL